MRKGLGVLFVLLALSATGCGKFTKGKAAAESQMAAIHQQFNDGDLGAILAGADPAFFKATSKADTLELFEAIRTKLGKVTNSQTHGWNVHAGTGGTTVRLAQQTTFETGSGTESFTFRIKNDQAKLLAYQINSRDLIVK